MNLSSLVNAKFLVSPNVLALGLVALLASAGAASAANRSLEGQTIVLYTSGGTQLEVTKDLVIEPFEKETGAKVIIDDGCCTKLQAAMQSGQFLGDVIVGEDSTQLLNQSNLGWFIRDPRIKKMAADHGVPPEFQSDSYLVTQRYSYVIAAKNKEIPLPTTWKEFWDVKKFPGSRGLIRLGPMVQLEGALIADGVPADKIYPIDEKRAFKKLDELKDSTRLVLNNSGADMINNLGTGETDYALVYSNRAFMAKQSGIGINFSYGDAFITQNGGAILKGAKNVDGAIAFLEYHMRPDVLARFAERTGMAPSYEASANMIKAEFKPNIATDPSNLPKQHVVDDSYWGKNLDALQAKWVEWLAQ